MMQKIKRFWKEKVARSDFRAQIENVALYDHLDSDDKETRLVTLKQGRFSDPIYCSLSKVSLEDALQYQALSYTWGDLDSVCQIYLNERLYPITRNLESALRHLRYVDKPRALWIDALCINQKDTLERNSQVMHMNSIFKQAFEVVAWLGDEDEDSNLVFDAFEALPKDSSIHWNSAAHSTFQKVLTDPKYGIAIRKFLQRSWWNRVWTVQESVLARTLHFVCGHRQISADTLLAVCDCFFIHLESESCCYGTFRDFVKTTAGAFHSLETLEIARSVAHRGNQIEDLIADYRTRHCTDPRDKVYGLLGMTRSEDSKVIVPNYSIPVSDVYEQVALQLIIHTRSLKIFSQLCRPGIVGTPSWVPDWTAELGHNQSRALAIRFGMIHYYRASSGSFSRVRLIGQGKLTLRGILFGSCRVFSESNSGRYYSSDYNNDTYKFWPDMAGITTNPGRLYANSNSTTYYDAYWQTLCASLLADVSDLGGVKKARTSDRSFYQSWYEAWWNSPRPSSKSRIDQNTSPSNAASANPANSDITRAQIACFASFVEAATLMRKLFISEEGWLGLAPMDAEVGDRIALLEGGNVPYIVRRKFSPGNEWEIIGDAYFHGIMDGQGWKPDQLVDIVLV